MVALVGGERDLPEVLDNLVQLDLDIRESYDAALPGVTTDALRTMLKAFKEDHQKQRGPSPSCWKGAAGR